MKAETVILLLDGAAAIRSLAARIPAHAEEMRVLASQMETFAREKRDPTAEELAQNRVAYLAVSDQLRALADRGASPFPPGPVEGLDGSDPGAGSINRPPRVEPAG